MAKYFVAEFLGDYPIEGQKDWNIEFETIEEAIASAKSIFAEADKAYCRYGAMDPSYHVIVGDVDGEKVFFLKSVDGEFTGVKARKQADRYAAMPPLAKGESK